MRHVHGHILEFALARAQARWALAVCVIAAVLTLAMPAVPEGEVHCARCDVVVAEKTQVAVTDFADDREHLYCNVACALRDMRDKYPTARAIAHDPFAGKEVRVIRTGARWVAWPKSAVFLFLPNAEDLEPGQRCQAFPRQVEYVQYLATHPEVAAHTPRPLRLKQLLAELKKHEEKQKASEPGNDGASADAEQSTNDGGRSADDEG